MNSIEAFFSEYEKTSSALAAISTFAAVVVSLWLARHSTKTQLKANVYRSMVVHDSIAPNDRPRFVCVNITNTGSTPLRIPYSYFQWKVPFHKNYWVINPFDHSPNNPYVPKREYPIKIEQKYSESFFLSDKPSFHSEMKEGFKDIKYLAKLRGRYIKALVFTDDGSAFKAKISKEVIKDILNCT